MITQIIIAFTGIVAICLTQTPGKDLQRWACIFGLAGQPFWFIAALDAEQVGVLFVSVFYSIAWCYGFWEHWVKSDSKNE